MRLLFLSKYIYNDSNHSVIGRSSFYVCNDRDPRIFQLLDAELPGDINVNVTKMTIKLQQLHEVLRDELIKAQDSQAEYYDRGRKRLTLKKEHQV